jgi:hypothetical protein
MIVAGIWCFVAITFLFQKGGLVNWGHEKALGASSFTEGVPFLAGAVHEIAGLEGDEILLFVVVGVWVVSFALFHFYFERRTAKFLQILDKIHEIYENQEAFNDITSVTEFEGIAVIGMRFSHPVTLSWQFFRSFPSSKIIVIRAMPSTTNSLEATHGHLNEAISPRNRFWASLALLFEAIADKTIHFETATVHDFRTSLKRSKRRSQSVSQQRMAEECAFFGSTAEVDSCAETVHVSSSY